MSVNNRGYQSSYKSYLYSVHYINTYISYIKYICNSYTRTTYICKIIVDICYISLYVCFAQIFQFMLDICNHLYFQNQLPLHHHSHFFLSVFLSHSSSCFCPLIILCGPSVHALGFVTKCSHVLISCSTGGEHSILGFQECFQWLISLIKTCGSSQLPFSIFGMATENVLSRV